MRLQEGRYEFDFTAAINAIKWDSPSTPCPKEMKKVDFVVEEADRWILVELKDPSDPETTQPNRLTFIHRLKSGTLVNDSLAPKFLDTWTCMRRIGMKKKPILQVAIISLYEHKSRPGRFLPIQQSLRKRMKADVSDSWHSEYAENCVVLNVARWNREFPAYPAVDRHGQAQRP